MMVAGARLAPPPAVAASSTEAREGTEGTERQEGDYHMTKPKREQHRERFLALITGDDRTRAAGIELAADLLHVSTHTVISWLKPEGGKSSSPVPLMALELLEIKLKAARKGKR